MLISSLAHRVRVLGALWNYTGTHKSFISPIRLVQLDIIYASIVWMSGAPYI